MPVHGQDFSRTTGGAPLPRESGAWKGAALCLVAASVLSVGLAAAIGPLDIPSGDVFSILLSTPRSLELPEAWKVVVTDIRLSRTILAWLTGAALGAAGTVYQGILQNPLADPFTLGVSTGAAFGASLAIFLGLGAAASLGGLTVLPLAGLVGAMAALALVLALARVGGRFRRDTLVLAGIVTATFLSALISLVKSLDEESVSSIVFWIMGSFQGRGWSHAALLAPYLAVGLPPLIFWSRELDILSLGETQARQLGVNASRVRLLLLTGASLATGAAVAVAGVIGFVGLIVPHLVRMVLGAEHRPLLICSSLLGGVLLLWSDVLARTILPGGAELPVGVVTALLGGPFFCLLLRRKASEGEL